MKRLLLAVVLLCAACAPLSEITKDPSVEVRKAVGQLESTVKSIRSEIQPYANTAVMLCKDQVSDECRSLASASNTLENALQAAEKGIKAYRAGEETLSEVYALVREALELAEDYAREVLALHARSNA